MKSWDKIFEETFESKRCKKKNCHEHHNENGCHEYRIRIENFSGFI